MIGTMLGGVVRTVMATFGGTLIASGLASGGDVEALSGAVATLVALGWSIWTKYQAQAK